jgi:negative regulator of replication initiation
MSRKLEKVVKESRAPKELAEAVKTEEKKSKAVSLRIEEELYRAIEAQAKVWNEKPSETVRDILRFYFLPAIYEVEAEKKTLALSEAELTAKRAGEYIKFVYEVVSKVEKVLSFLKSEMLTLNELMQEKLQQVLEEEKKEAET